MIPHLTIRVAGEPDLDPLAGLIARAFHRLAVAEWLVPDPIERQAIFPRYFRLFVEPAITEGQVYTVGDLSAVAIWLPVIGEPAPPPDDYDDRLQAICGRHVERFRVFDAALDEHHPHDPQHDYLAFLAALPERQNAGLGTALLREHHRRLDTVGRPAYLEASSERSRDLYLREGYRPHGDPYRLPDGPPMYPLWREPRG